MPSNKSNDLQENLFESITRAREMFTLISRAMKLSAHDRHLHYASLWCGHKFNAANPFGWERVHITFAYIDNAQKWNNAQTIIN